MKINAKFFVQANDSRLSKLKKSFKKPIRYKKRKSFYRLNFHPADKQQACICCVIQSGA
jgi:hypothetical protein